MKNKFQSIILRYSTLLIMGFIFALTNLFYQILLPLTIYPVYFLLKLGFQPLMAQSFIFIGETVIEIIPACVAASAYFLLIALNLTVYINPKQRIYSLLFSILALLTANIIRIYILSLLLLNQVIYFEIVHKVFWYLLSIVFVIGIWFATIHIFKIKKIPGYSDIKFLLKISKKRKK